uniref:Uncharacterized protein n=1 Tax=Oreochromis aureus TaxID=47969 RepID=A0AAZ1X0R4_OREAU
SSNFCYPYGKGHKAKQYKVHHSTVIKITHKWKTFKTVGNLPRTGPPSKFTPSNRDLFTYKTCRRQSGEQATWSCRLLLSDSFVSQTKQHYQPPIRSGCSGSSTNLVNKPGNSGFHQLRIQPKTASVEEKTEYQSSFVPHRPTPAVSQNHVTVGPKGGSGFTKAAERQINTSLIGEPHQTPSSVMKTDFVPLSLLQGTEAKSGLCSRSCRETGFTRGDIAPLAHPVSLLSSRQTKTKAPVPSTIGQKEPTGYLLNTHKNQTFPDAPFDPSDFITHYKSKFCHRDDPEKFKSMNSCPRIVSSKMESGYNLRDTDRYILRG